MKGDEYPAPPCALAKILPEATVSAYFSQIENNSSTTNIHFLHSQQIIFVRVCIRAGNPRVPPRVWPLGQNPEGATRKSAQTHKGK